MSQSGVLHKFFLFFFFMSKFTNKTHVHQSGLSVIAANFIC